MQLLGGLLSGEVDEPPSIKLSEAVALQLYWLFVDQKLRTEQLSGFGWEGLYRVLASFATGTTHLHVPRQCVLMRQLGCPRGCCFKLAAARAAFLRRLHVLTWRSGRAGGLMTWQWLG